VDPTTNGPADMCSGSYIPMGRRIGAGSLLTNESADMCSGSYYQWDGGYVQWILLPMGRRICAVDPTTNGPVDRCRILTNQWAGGYVQWILLTNGPAYRCRAVDPTNQWAGGCAMDPTTHAMDRWKAALDPTTQWAGVYVPWILLTNWPVDLWILLPNGPADRCHMDPTT
jgi:hypothetical protein